jgi:hypothetical protein
MEVFIDPESRGHNRQYHQQNGSDETVNATDHRHGDGETIKQARV